MNGKWYVGSRGTNAKPWAPWSWTALVGSPSLGTLGRVAAWAAQGQHVRLEFVPDGVFSPDLDLANVVDDQGA